MTENDSNGNIRQISISSLNQSVIVLSSFEKEDIIFLSKKALMLFKKIKSDK